MTDQSLSEPDTSLEARWLTLKQGMKIWADGAASGEYAQGVLTLRLAANLYSSPFKLLVNRALKSMVLVSILPNSGHFPTFQVPWWVISIMDDKSEGLKREIADLRAESGPKAVATTEQQASEARILVNHLKAELEEAD
ncbi:hypothetical protein B296_00019117 [Ensete ventricosum]|uniref:Uncharacterized protein n=1 Tax=Ensete ventricosum TaxID=4639 RepID=A0A426ZEW9_ENSVE|nr:hypothetical protein B296_00019117 [Ensete ventricosum]